MMKEVIFKEKIQKLVNSITSEEEIYYLDVDFLQEETDLEPPFAVPYCKKGGDLVGIAVMHVCEINGEIMSYDREVECEFPSIKEAS